MVQTPFPSSQNQAILLHITVTLVPTQVNWISLRLSASFSFQLIFAYSTVSQMATQQQTRRTEQKLPTSNIPQAKRVRQHLTKTLFSIQSLLKHRAQYVWIVCVPTPKTDHQVYIYPCLKTGDTKILVSLGTKMDRVRMSVLSLSPLPCPKTPTLLTDFRPQ